MGWPSARLFGWSTCDWSSPVNSKSISSETKIDCRHTARGNQKQLEHELVVWGMIAPLKNHQQIDWTSGHICAWEHINPHPYTSRACTSSCTWAQSQRSHKGEVPEFQVAVSTLSLCVLSRKRLMFLNTRWDSSRNKCLGRRAEARALEFKRRCKKSVIGCQLITRAL